MYYGKLKCPFTRMDCQPDCAVRIRVITDGVFNYYCGLAGVPESAKYGVMDSAPVEQEIIPYVPMTEDAAEYAARQKYEQEPLVQLFRLLLQETSTGGKWTYKQLIELGVDKLGYEPFSSGKECGAKLRKGLAANLLARDGIRVEWAIKTATGNGVEIHRKG